MKNIIFLDFDGVLNCQDFYQKLQREQALNTIGTQKDIDPWRVSLLNTLCKDTNSSIVISSSWRYSGLEYCKKALKLAGAEFEIIDSTPILNYKEVGHTPPRGVEIKAWLDDNCYTLFGIHSHDFYRYAIIDDDSDMLLNQQYHFFRTDPYSGLTPHICDRIKTLFLKKTFFPFKIND